MNQAIFYQYNPWWEGGFTLATKIHERPELLQKIEEALKNPGILFVTGLRRIGKTTLMKMMVTRLISQGIAPTHIFYISLDDYLLQKPSILDILDTFRKMHKIPQDQEVFLFLDEVASKDEFQKQLKTIYDREKVKIIAASSSSSILRDSQAQLTGRTRIIEVMPLNFTEYLRFREVKWNKRDNSLLTGHFETFLHTGGIPEYVLFQNREYLHQLIDDIISKDIIAWHGLKNQRQVRDCFLLLMEQAGGPVSITRIARILRISPDTASRYFHMFANAYLIHFISRFGKISEHLLAPKKVYASDLGIRCMFTAAPKIGKLLENYVYLQTKAHSPAYIYESGTELDFMYKDGTLAEVKYGEEILGKQKELFDSFAAKQRVIVQSSQDVDELVAQLNTSTLNS